MRCSVAAVALAGVATLLAGVSPALADGISLSASPNPAVFGAPATFTAQGTLPVSCQPDENGISNCRIEFFVEPPGTPCSAGDAASGDGYDVTGPAGSAFSVTDTQGGRWVGGVAGLDKPETALLCAFLESVPPGEENPVTSASGQLPLPLREPHYSLRLKVPARAVAGHKITVTVTAQAEARGLIAAQILPRGYRSCAAARGPLEAPALFLVWDRAQQETWARLPAGNFTATRRVKPVRAGRYIFCAWIDPSVSGNGGYITVQKKQVVRAAKRHKRHKRRKHH